MAKKDASAAGAKFKQNETVLCYHGPHLYMAKVLDTKLQDDEWRYKVHYHGWNKTWNEYVDDTRVLKYNNENRELQKKIKKQMLVKKRKEEKGKKKTPKAPDAETRKQLAVETEEEYNEKIEVKLKISNDLKALLVQDWQEVIANQKLVPLPRTPNITKILEGFNKHGKKKKLAIDDDVVQELLAGIKTYFEHSLGTLLLYDFERPQYEDSVKDCTNGDVCDVYGAEHLLRLFVKLPHLLAHTDIKNDSLEILLSHLKAFLAYLVANSATFFMRPDEYEEVTEDYQARLGKH